MVATTVGAEVNVECTNAMRSTLFHEVMNFANAPLGVTGLTQPQKYRFFEGFDVGILEKKPFQHLQKPTIWRNDDWLPRTCMPISQISAGFSAFQSLI